MADFTDLAEMLERAKLLSDLAGNVAKDDFLTDMLEASAAGATYRPYWVAAKALNVATYRVQKAPEADFRDVSANIRALLALQAAEDARLGLTVPTGYEATVEALGLGGIRMPASRPLSNEATF